MSVLQARGSGPKALAHPFSCRDGAGDNGGWRSVRGKPEPMGGGSDLERSKASCAGWERSGLEGKCRERECVGGSGVKK